MQLMTFNVSYIHKNLALRWLNVTNPFHHAIIKEYTLKTSLDEVMNDLVDQAIDVIGLSVYIFNHDKSKQFIQRLKQENPSVRIIVGGPEVTYQVDRWLRYGADMVIRGEGEFAFWKAVNHEIVDGVATILSPITSVLQIDLSLLEKVENPYFLEMDKSEENNRYLYLEASRGCPFSCTYCMAGIEHGVRSFSLEYMTSIIKQIQSSKVSNIKFLDRTFNSNPTRALTLIRLLNNIENDLSIQLEVEVSIWDEQLHEFFIHEGKKDRFRFEIGVQTFDQITLKSIRRKQNNKKLKQVIASLTNAGYVVHADLIAGLPFEDYLQFSKSFEQLLVLFPSEIQLGILKGLSGTELYENSQILGMDFDFKAPYIIKSNPWMSVGDLKNLEYAALAVEKIYNKKIAITLIKILVEHNQEILDWFVKVGKAIFKLGHPYQVSDVIQCILNETTFIDYELILACLANDLGVKSKTKVKSLPRFDIDTNTIKIMEIDISKRSNQHVSQWKSNSWLYLSLVGSKIGYQWIVYGIKKRYYYTKGAEFVYEQDHFISK